MGEQAGMGAEAITSEQEALPTIDINPVALD